LNPGGKGNSHKCCKRGITADCPDINLRSLGENEKMVSEHWSNVEGIATFLCTLHSKRCGIEPHLFDGGAFKEFTPPIILIHF